MKSKDSLTQKTTIRQMIGHDFKRVMQLERLCYGKSSLCAGRLREMLRSRRTRAIVATDHPSILGYCVYTENADGFDIFRLGVDPLLQRRGIARHLVQMVKTRVENAGKRRVFAFIDLENIEAQKAMHAMEFQVAHVETGEFVIMEYDSMADDGNDLAKLLIDDMEMEL